MKTSAEKAPPAAHLGIAGGDQANVEDDDEIEIIEDLSVPLAKPVGMQMNEYNALRECVCFMYGDLFLMLEQYLPPKYRVSQLNSKLIFRGKFL